MEEHPDAHDPPAGRSAHGQLSRTWELELLISGAVVFALMQAPEAMDRAYSNIEPQVDGILRLVLSPMYLYGKLIVYALTGAFLLHLSARAYWVGLIGLDSVFPSGIRWQDTGQGPIAREVYSQRLPGLPALIRRLDDFCSVIFSFAFMVVVTFALSLVFTGVAGVLASGISYLFFEGRHTSEAFFAVAGALVLVSTVLPLLDRRFSEQLRDGSRLKGFFRRAFLVLYHTSALPLYGPIYFTLVSNLRRRGMTVAMVAIFGGLMLFGLITDLAQRDRIALDSYRYLPENGGSRDMNFQHYESLRPAAGRFHLIPSVQSDVIREPFVKLFIPYGPLSHNRAVARTCPGVQPLTTRTLRRREGWDAPVPDSVARSVLDCLTRLHRVTLNSRVQHPEFSFYTHPRTEMRGLLAYLPTDSLRRGRNVLTVSSVPQYHPDGTLRKEQRSEYIIPLWR